MKLLPFVPDNLEDWQASACIIWPWATTSGGYGQIRVNGKRWIVSRYAWTLVNGPIPDGMLVLHHCDTPACYNLAHLFLGTGKDNMDDALDGSEDPDGD